MRGVELVDEALQRAVHSQTHSKRDHEHKDHRQPVGYALYGQSCLGSVEAPHAGHAETGDRAAGKEEALLLQINGQVICGQIEDTDHNFYLELPHDAWCDEGNQDSRNGDDHGSQGWVEPERNWEKFNFKVFLVLIYPLL